MSAVDEAFAAGCRDGRLLLQRCGDCGAAQLYPRRYCTSCRSLDLGWERASGAGSVYSFTVVRRAPSAAFADRVPYVLALVELAEGPRVFSSVVDVAPEAVSIGMPVEVGFDGDALPVFRPVAA